MFSFAKPWKPWQLMSVPSTTRFSPTAFWVISRSADTGTGNQMLPMETPWSRTYDETPPRVIQQPAPGTQLEMPPAAYEYVGP